MYTKVCLARGQQVVTTPSATTRQRNHTLEASL